MPAPRKAPRVCARVYTGNLIQGSLAIRHKANVTAGFKWPPAEDNEHCKTWNNGKEQKRGQGLISRENVNSHVHLVRINIVSPTLSHHGNTFYP